MPTLSPRNYSKMRSTPTAAKECWAKLVRADKTYTGREVAANKGNSVAGIMSSEMERCKISKRRRCGNLRRIML